LILTEFIDPSGISSLASSKFLARIPNFSLPEIARGV
jgi:hypothetical protein